MTINEPRLNVYGSSASPVMILGIMLGCASMVMKIFGNYNEIVIGAIGILGIVLFIAGLIGYALSSF